MLCSCPALAAAVVLAVKRSVRVWASDFSWGFSWGVGSGELRWFGTSFFSSGFQFPSCSPRPSRYHTPGAGTACFELCSCRLHAVELPVWLPRSAGLVLGELRHHAAERDSVLLPACRSALQPRPCPWNSVMSALKHWSSLPGKGMEWHLGTWLLLYLAVPDE